MTCPVCGTHPRDRAVLAIITAVPGDWVVKTHQGHIVKIARKEREMTIDEALDKYQDLLTGACPDDRIAQTE